MTVQWKTVFVKTTIWLATEIVLNLVGLDNLADYSEFIYEQEVVGLGHLNQPVVVIQVP